MFFYNEDSENTALGLAGMDEPTPANNNDPIYWDYKRLSDPNVGSLFYFGESFDMSDDGNYVVVGAKGHEVPGDGSTSYAGKAYVFEKGADNSWSNYFELVVSDPVETFDEVGHSVAISGDGNVIAVGSTEVLNPGDARGVVYVFEKTGPMQWTEVDVLTITLEEAGVASSSSATGFGDGPMSIDQNGHMIVVGGSSKVFTFYRGGLGQPFNRNFDLASSGSTDGINVRLVKEDKNYTIMLMVGSKTYVWYPYQYYWEIVEKYVYVDQIIDDQAYFLDENGSYIPLDANNPDMVAFESEFDSSKNGIANTAIVLGYPGYDNNGVTDQGKAAIYRDISAPTYVYNEVGGPLIRIERRLAQASKFDIYSPASGFNTKFGYSVEASQDGENVFIGAGGNGRIYLFKYHQPSNNYYLAGYLLTSTTGDGWGLRIRASKDGRTVVINQHMANSPGTDSGRLHIFTDNS